MGEAGAKALIAGFMLVLAAAATAQGQGRTWTDQTGRELRAGLEDFNPASGEVALRSAEKNELFQVPLRSLSEADQIFVKKWQAHRETPPFRGLKEAFTLTARFSDDPRDYHTSTGRAEKAWKYFRQFHSRLATDASGVKRLPPEEAVSLAAGRQRALVYVPENYPGAGDFGLYLHLSPLDEAWLPKGYETVLAKHRLIFVSPHDGGNNHGEWERLGQALNALATVRAEFAIDEERAVIGGFSGGGYMSFWIQFLHSELFRGALNHGRDYPLERIRTSAGVYPAAMPYLNDRDIREAAGGENWWIFLMGQKDPNIGRLQVSLEQWESAGFETQRFIDLGKEYEHRPAPPGKLDEALSIVLDEEPPAAE